MNLGPNNSVLWSKISQLSYRFNANEVHQWLQHNLDFWNNNQFDHMAFVAWYEHANFQDKEIVYKYLTPKEQAAVLKTWHQQMPPRPIVTQLRAHSNNTNFLDGHPPIRDIPKSKEQKGAYTRF